LTNDTRLTQDSRKLIEDNKRLIDTGSDIVIILTIMAIDTLSNSFCPEQCTYLVPERHVSQQQSKLANEP